MFAILFIDKFSGVATLKLSVNIIIYNFFITLAKSPAYINCLKGLPVPNKFNSLFDVFIFLSKACYKMHFIFIIKIIIFTI